MHILFQLAFYLLLCLICEAVAAYLPFPFPGAVLAMLVLLLLLSLKWLKTCQLMESSDFLRSNMGLFFVPPSVGILGSFGLLRRELWPFLIICVMGTVVTFVTTALISSVLIRLQNRWEQKTKAKGEQA